MSPSCEAGYRLQPWEKVGQGAKGTHDTGGQAGSSIKFPGDRDVVENSKMKEITLKTKGQGFTCLWGWPPSSTMTQLLGGGKPGDPQSALAWPEHEVESLVKTPYENELIEHPRSQSNNINTEAMNLLEGRDLDSVPSSAVNLVVNLDKSFPLSHFHLGPL